MQALDTNELCLNELKHVQLENKISSIFLLKIVVLLSLRILIFIHSHDKNKNAIANKNKTNKILLNLSILDLEPMNTRISPFDLYIIKL